MPSLLAICAHDTEENDRTKYTKETLRSLSETVDWSKGHELYIIDNNSCGETKSFLKDFQSKLNYKLITCSENVGTAKGINMALALRKPNQVCIKMDNDVVVHQSGWVEELEEIIAQNPQIGILGLMRSDIYGNFTQDGKLLYGDDIMGTCTALNPLLLDKIGFYFQHSKNYGFDDSNISVRSIAAGFKNAFLPHIKITHIDTGGTAYTEWKKKEAAFWLQEASIAHDLIRKGLISYYYDGQ
jgi:hypothetical protein